MKVMYSSELDCLKDYDNSEKYALLTHIIQLGINKNSKKYIDALINSGISLI